MRTARSLVRVLFLASLPVASCVAAVPPAVAGGSVSGTVTLHALPVSSDGPSAVDASWRLYGGLKPALATAARLGTAVQVTPDQDTDSRYALATLSAAQAPWSTACDFVGTGGVSRVSMTGVADARSAIDVSIVLDQLRGRGTVHAAPARSVNPAVYDMSFAPGFVMRQTDADCYGPPVVTDIAKIPALSNYGSSFLPGDMLDWSNGIAWRLHHIGRGHAWTGGGTAARDVNGFRESVSTSITLSGTGAALHARCTLPTARNLRAARSFRVARAVVVRAGFASPRRGTSRHTRAARAGHWYLREAVGNSEPFPCGQGRLHLDRSLGASRH